MMIFQLLILRAPLAFSTRRGKLLRGRHAAALGLAPRVVSAELNIARPASQSDIMPTAIYGVHHVRGRKLDMETRNSAGIKLMAVSSCIQ